MTKIYMSNVEGKPNHRALTKPLICEHWDGSIKYIPEGFEWDGSSVPVVFQGLFPKHLDTLFRVAGMTSGAAMPRIKQNVNGQTSSLRKT
jgi:hypothetical protein